MTIHMEHPLFAEERQEEIVRLLRTKDRLTVPQLCEHFQVSAAVSYTHLTLPTIA